MAMNREFSISFPFAKAAGTNVVKGFMSVNGFDRSEDLVAPESFLLKRFMANPQLQYNHRMWLDDRGNEINIGTVLEAKVAKVTPTAFPDMWGIADEAGVVFDTFSKAKAPDLVVGTRGVWVRAQVNVPEVWKMVESRELNAFSWRGMAKFAKVLFSNMEYVFTRMVDLWECSLVNIPDNHAATFEVAKSLPKVIVNKNKMTLDGPAPEYNLVEVLFSTEYYTPEKCREWLQKAGLNPSVQMYAKDGELRFPQKEKEGRHYTISVESGVTLVVTGDEDSEHGGDDDDMSKGAGLSHDSRVEEDEPSWGSVDKTKLPYRAFVWQAPETDPDTVSTWKYPHHYVPDGGSLDDNGRFTSGTMYLHVGGLSAAWGAAMGARSGQEAPEEVIEHLRKHRDAIDNTKEMEMGKEKETPEADASVATVPETIETVEKSVETAPAAVASATVAEEPAKAPEEAKAPEAVVEAKEATPVVEPKKEAEAPSMADEIAEKVGKRIESVLSEGLKAIGDVIAKAVASSNTSTEKGMQEPVKPEIEKAPEPAPEKAADPVQPVAKSVESPVDPLAGYTEQAREKLLYQANLSHLLGALDSLKEEVREVQKSVVSETVKEDQQVKSPEAGSMDALFSKNWPFN